MTPWVVVAIVVTVIAWASAFVVIRGVGSHLGGGELALGRLLVGTVLLSLLLIGRPWIRPTGREWLLIVVYGVAWFGAYNVTLNIAEHTLDAGTTSMIVNIGPILIALGAGIFLGEGIPKWLAIGAGIAFGGVVLIGVGSGMAGLGNGIGILWALIAAVAYTIGVLCQKRLMRRIPSTQVTWLGCALGALVCLPFAGSLVVQLQAAPVSVLLGVLYLGAVPTSLAFTTWGYALSKLPAGQLGVTTYVVPAIVVVLGFAAFGEIPTVLAIVGGVICLIGVAVSRRRSQRDRDPSDGLLTPETPLVPAAPQNLSQ
ncbi:DMT family transporter [Terrimesophilobacter mesophilus]|uniref:DMT family transporter n=2 Tax=Terrimesophilobacter mesophilus TaxID=433647 RepID=A0A4R8VEY3_9MICO|nr:DMT family transporter [Terrimesophilobacter mesophilus]TFB80750.1 DMT family transporter [Terrimesophilobacter mesophilus]